MGHCLPLSTGVATIFNDIVYGAEDLLSSRLRRCLAPSCCVFLAKVSHCLVSLRWGEEEVMFLLRNVL